MDIYFFTDIHCRMSLLDILAWISMWISTPVWVIEDCHPKIMDIHVDIRGFLEIHAWICYGFSVQGDKSLTLDSQLSKVTFPKME